MKLRWQEFLLLPNIITLFRLILSLVVPVLWIKSFNPRIIYALIILGAFSDTLDGNLARLQKCKTTLGKLLDPLADKCFINMLYFLFYYEGQVSFLLFGVILGRDLLILLAALYLLLLTKEISLLTPSLLGKASTVSQLITLVLLFSQTYLFSIPSILLGLSLNFTLFLTLASGFHYALMLKRLLWHAKGLS